MPFTVKQQLRPVTQTDLDAADAAVLIVNPAATPRAAAEIPYDTELKQRLKKAHKSSWTSSPTCVDLPNRRATRCATLGLTPDISQFELLTAARRALNSALSVNPNRLVIALVGIEPQLAARTHAAIVTTLLALTEALPTFKKEPLKPSPLRQVVLCGHAKKVDLKRANAAANGNNLARRLTSLPPNRLTPGDYRREVAQLAKRHGWQMTYLDRNALTKKKAGAFLAVAQGHPQGEAGIIHLRYRPARSARGARPLALVGKGICFDTGGTNLKPAKSMHGMHEDMEGSAVALGTLLALSELKVNFPIDCWLALSENMIGPLAYKQNDVVTACNGTTIEVVHTDAEGRMVLADTLALAVRDKPAAVIDYATLTGACVYALSTRYSGAFTNRPQWLDDIIAAGRDSGERVWPFPADKDFDDELESQVADIKQCTLGGEADHIYAARFLGRFVGDTPWIHLDLAAGNNKGGLAHIPSDVTGFGVLFTLELVLGRNLLKNL